MKSGKWYRSRFYLFSLAVALAVLLPLLLATSADESRGNVCPVCAYKFLASDADTYSYAIRYLDGTDPGLGMFIECPQCHVLRRFREAER